MEEWRLLDKYPGHYVSNLGRIKGPNGIRKLCYDKNGYLLIKINIRGKHYTRLVHWLVLEAFIGPRPDGMLGCHNDGSKDNCKLSNLRWDTPKNNTADMKIHGTQFRPRGSLCGTSKLTWEKVREIRELAKTGLSQRAIGNKYGVGQVAVFNILRGNTWKESENGSSSV